LGEAEAMTTRGLYLLPIETPQAFVLGALKPRVFVTRGLFKPENEQHRASVIAHEQAHLARADTLRRLLAAAASRFQLPGVARAMERRLSRAHEMAADEEAARVVGRRVCVARALLHLARAAAQSPRQAITVEGSDVDVRVRALLSAPTNNHHPGARALLFSGAPGLGAIAAAAEAIHRGLE